jgi:ATP-dependent helicase HrpB
MAAPASPPLPILPLLPALRAALAARGVAVLQAPPGAGKTTAVPLDLLALFPVGRIVMLEPRRLAARAAAERMAATLGEPLGATVGYRIRGEARVGPATRIEVVTEGILTRMIQADPELSGIACLIFDEFHERSLNADLGLALALEVRGALRPDLALLVMSATLDGGPVAALLGDAPLLTAEGRAFPVETRWLPRPPDPSLRFAGAATRLVLQAVDETAEETAGGGVLVFLPGEGEIARVAAALDLPGCDIRPLFGAMQMAAQRAALAPSARRKVVLATSIAETSLTLPDIRVVVDTGRARRARFDPASGMARLVTERVTRAEAEQRRGRAGRVAPGVCYRMWTKGEEGGLAPFPPAEIEAGDLAPLALELALWGAEGLPFLTPPPAAALAEARALLQALGALDGEGRITAHGRSLAGLPLHPRLAHMLAVAGPGAAPLAALLADRDPLRGEPPDLARRLAALDRPPPGADRATVERIRAEAARLRRIAPRGPRQATARPEGNPAPASEPGPAPASEPGPPLSPGALAALAYPDRIGLRRAGEAPRWLLSGGKGAAMAPGLPLSGARLLVATDLDGDPREATIRQAAPLEEEELRALMADRIAWVALCEWSRREGRLRAVRQERLGALVLAERPWPEAPAEARARAMLEGLRLIDPAPSPAAARVIARIALAVDDSGDWPDLRPGHLWDDPADWILPALAPLRSEAELRALDIAPALAARLTWAQKDRLERLAPAAFVTPLGRAVPIDYAGDHPAIEVRLQEMFGLDRHPVVGADRRPLRLTLLSPAQRPLQVTLDLPGFWRTSYAEVRKEMRGAYPRHPWPEDPTQAAPTLRAKPRGT